jgi:hypothetical protein
MLHCRTTVIASIGTTAGAADIATKEKAMARGKALFLTVLLALGSSDRQVHALAQAESTDAAVRSPSTDQREVAHSLASLPLSFEENRGQAPQEFSHLAKGSESAVLLSSREALISWNKSGQALTLPRSEDSHMGPPAPALVEDAASGALRMKLLGAATTAGLQGVAELPGKVSYFAGRDPAKWITGIPTYSRLRGEQVYPGVDIEYYGNPQKLEFDFIVHPGADSGAIAMGFEGAEGLELAGNGDLVVHLRGGEMRFQAPVGYQVADGRRLTVQAAYELHDDQRITFRIGPYDATRPLVIDPVVDFSTHLGPMHEAIAVDGSGNVYVTGSAWMNFVPEAVHIGPPSGFAGVMVAKLDPCGTGIVYAATVYGGDVGGSGIGIGVDAEGNAFVTGVAGAGFPVTPGAFDETYNGGSEDTFVFQLNDTGTNFVYSTYLGGSDHDQPAGIAVHPSGIAVVAGRTTSGNFPTPNGSQPTFAGGLSDAFVTAFDSSGSLIYSTFLGGGGYDDARGVAVDGEMNAYVTGVTGSSNFPIVGDGVDGTMDRGDFYVTKLDPASALVYSTFLGGSGNDGTVSYPFWPERGLDIAVDEEGFAYITGSTESANFPTTSGAWDEIPGGPGDCFITKLPQSGSTAYVFSTRLGGNGGEACTSVAVDSSGNVYVTGNQVGSSDFPLLDEIHPLPDYGAIVTKLDASGAFLLYSTPFGVHTAGFSIAVDGAGHAFVTGAGANFPLVNPLEGPGADGGFIARLSTDDCQPNGVGDVCDLNSGTSDDCDSNSLPDECQLDSDGDEVIDACDNCVLLFNPDQADCQPNGTGDVCDIADGISQDCNDNDVADECEADADGDGFLDACDNCPDHPNPAQDDCDDDGVGDVCVLATGQDQDCNTNLIPDLCDIAAQTSSDLNSNEAPDECDTPCVNVADCADLNNDNKRDDSCVWWECLFNLCTATGVVFADIGGQFGACPPDLTADGNDKFHALNCFSDQTTTGNPGYPCEASPPQAYNVDAGGTFGDCCPDGVCDGHDAFHALNAFEGDNVCSCPSNFLCPCTSPTYGNCSLTPTLFCSTDQQCPPGQSCNQVMCPAEASPAIDAPPGDEPGPRVAGRAGLRLEASSKRVRPGDVIEVDVFLDGALSDLRGYQLHVADTGGDHGGLVLADIFIERRKDAAFAGLPAWEAFNVRTQQMLAGLDGAGVQTKAGAYLATFVFRAGDDARGTFTIDLLHDDFDPAQRTFLFPTPPGAKIEIAATRAAAIEVSPVLRARTRRLPR